MHIGFVVTKNSYEPCAAAMYFITSKVRLDPELKDIFTPKVSSNPAGRMHGFITPKVSTYLDKLIDFFTSCLPRPWVEINKDSI
jgi:hypothetical protein